MSIQVYNNTINYYQLMINKKESKMNIENLQKKVAVLHTRYDGLNDWKAKSEVMTDIHDLELRIKLLIFSVLLFPPGSVNFK